MDGRGRMVLFEDGNTNQHHYEYDAAGRLLRVLRKGYSASSPSPYVAYTYQGPWVQTMHEGAVTDPAVVEWDYDALGRTTEKRMRQDNTPAWQTYTWEWDSSATASWIGVRHRTTDPIGETRYYYDEVATWGSLGRLTSVERENRGRPIMGFEYAYDFEGQTTSTTWPSGAEVLSTYDAGWKVQDTLVLPGGTPGETPLDVDYTYDAHWGSLKRWQTNGGNDTWQFDITRSSPNRMTRQKLSRNGLLTDEGIYEYNANGWLRRKAIRPHMTTWDKYLHYTYDDLGRIMKVSDPTRSDFEVYDYDAAGNLVSFDHQQDAGVEAWSYATPPQFGEIPSRTWTGGNTVDTHNWEAVTGRMRSWDTTVNGLTTVQRDFWFDGAGRLVQVQRHDGSKPTTTRLFYDVDDALVYEERDVTEITERFQGTGCLRTVQRWSRFFRRSGC